MSGATVMLAAHVALCLILIVGVVKRAIQMSADIRADVRAAFVLLGVAALYALGAPIVMCWHPDAVSLSTMAAMCLVQHVTARHWRDGVPRWYYKPECYPGEKREDAPAMPMQRHRQETARH